MSIGRLESESEVESYLVASLEAASPNVSAVTVIDGGVVTSTVTMPSSDLMVTGILDNWLDVDVVVRSQHLIEY